ncbi:MAG TPA: LD-carboxypeptidase, partial [Rubrivivax sp.]|nr:LD-carboxypeptidase [Rubrivivax sp.]
MTSLCLFTPSGVVPASPPLRLALKRLRGLGFDARLDPDALARHQRFGGDDAARLAAIHRVASAAPSIAMASRGGYGLTRLLDGIDWKLLAKSVAAGTRWVGHSDFTVLQTALLARTGAGSWAGPMALDDFSRAEEAGGVDEVTSACFVEAMGGELEAIGFRTEAGFDGLAARGLLWGGNLAMLCSLLGTRHWPDAKVTKGGILFVEDVNEHPYRVERCLLQLQQAGVLGQQRAVVLGAFTAFKPSPLDRGYSLKTVVARLRESVKTPILTGLPFGHVHPKVKLPVGTRV